MQRPKTWLATAILRSRVRASTGEDVGKVEDLVVDPATQRIYYAVLSVEGLPELFIVPWSSFKSSPWPDYLLLNIDRKTLERAPAFDPADWPEGMDDAWEQRIHNYYGTAMLPGPDRTVYPETAVYVERTPSPRSPMPVFGAVILTVLLIGMLWMAFLVWTRGWDDAKREIASSFQGAAYAMKETSQDAALTAKVKTAFSLSKRVPANQINVDSQGDVVTLRGEVPSDEIRMAAERIALDTPGVREVHNHLFATKRTQ